MKIIFLGDVVGKPGRKTVRKHLPGLIEMHQPDFVIANAENLAGGKGFNEEKIAEMLSYGVDFFTTGDHVYDDKRGVEYIKSAMCPVLKPANYPEETPGDGWRVIEENGKRLLVVNLIGRVFMKGDFDCPFSALERILSRFCMGGIGEARVEKGQNLSRKEQKVVVDGIFVDFHAEATAEKVALKWAFDGRISALVGTNTHVPTADREVTKKGTAYITDVGMVGAHESCIGVRSDIIIDKFLTQMPRSHRLEEKGVMELNGVVIEIGAAGRAKSIEQVRILE
jgi:2',3'-cyclic-nucleotide 2'-phosphodiesterase